MEGGERHPLIAAFLSMMTVERAAARNTVDAYRSDLEDYFAFLRQNDTELLSVGAEGLRGYVAALEARGATSATIARRVAALRRFHKFLHVGGYRADDPSVHIAPPNRDRRPRDILSAADVDLLLGTMRKRIDDAARPLAARFRAARIYAAVQTLYGSGLRVSDVVSLPVSVLDSRGWFVVARDRGAKPRRVRLSDRALTALSIYRALLAKRSPELAASPFLFPSSAVEGHLTRQAFTRDLKRAAFAAGLEARDISSDGLRYAFAGHLLENGADPRAVQEWLGHEHIERTYRLRDYIERRDLRHGA